MDISNYKSKEQQFTFGSCAASVNLTTGRLAVEIPGLSFRGTENTVGFSNAFNSQYDGNPNSSANTMGANWKISAEQFINYGTQYTDSGGITHILKESSPSSTTYTSKSLPGDIKFTKNISTNVFTASDSEDNSMTFDSSGKLIETKKCASAKIIYDYSSGRLIKISENGYPGAYIGFVYGNMTFNNTQVTRLKESHLYVNGTPVKSLFYTYNCDGLLTIITKRVYKSNGQSKDIALISMRYTKPNNYSDYRLDYVCDMQTKEALKFGYSTTGGISNPKVSQIETGKSGDTSSEPCGASDCPVSGNAQHKVPSFINGGTWVGISYKTDQYPYSNQTSEATVTTDKGVSISHFFNWDGEWVFCMEKFTGQYVNDYKHLCKLPGQNLPLAGSPVYALYRQINTQPVHYYINSNSGGSSISVFPQFNKNIKDAISGYLTKTGNCQKYAVTFYLRLQSVHLGNVTQKAKTTIKLAGTTYEGSEFYDVHTTGVWQFVSIPINIGYGNKNKLEGFTLEILGTTSLEIGDVRIAAAGESGNSIQPVYEYYPNGSIKKSTVSDEYGVKTVYDYLSNGNLWKTTITGAQGGTIGSERLYYSNNGLLWKEISEGIETVYTYTSSSTPLLNTVTRGNLQHVYEYDDYGEELKAISAYDSGTLKAKHELTASFNNGVSHITVTVKDGIGNVFKTYETSANNYASAGTDKYNHTGGGKRQWPKDDSRRAYWDKAYKNNSWTNLWESQFGWPVTQISGNGEEYNFWYDDEVSLFDYSQKNGNNNVLSVFKYFQSDDDVYQAWNDNDGVVYTKTYDSGKQNPRFNRTTVAGKEIFYYYDQFGALEEKNRDGFIYEILNNDRAQKKLSREIIFGKPAAYKYKSEVNCQSGKPDNIVYTKDGKADYTVGYTYDALGRILTENHPKMGNKTYTYNPDGTVKTINNAPPPQYPYNANGFMTSKGPYALTWTNNYLTGYKSVNNTYDFYGRRKSKTYNNATTEYAWDGGKLVAERPAGSNYYNIIYYIYDAEGISRIYNRFNTNINYFTCKDALGNTSVIYNTNSGARYQFVYDFNGNFKVYNSAGSDVTASAKAQYSVCPFLWKGYYYDYDMGLYYINGRWYDPEIGQFVSFANSESLCYNINNIGYLNPHGFGVPNPLLFPANGYNCFPSLPLSANCLDIGKFKYIPKWQRDLSNWWNGLPSSVKIGAGIIVITGLAIATVATAGGGIAGFSAMGGVLGIGTAATGATGILAGATVGATIAAGLGAGFGALSALIGGKNVGNAAANGFMWGAFSGALSGALGETSITLIGQLIGNSAISVGAYGAQCFFTGENPTLLGFVLALGGGLAAGVAYQKDILRTVLIDIAFQSGGLIGDGVKRIWNIKDSWWLGFNPPFGYVY